MFNSDFQKGLSNLTQQMKQKEIWVKDAAVAEMLIKEIKDPLDLIRELISNSAAKEVSANRIIISLYIHPDFGQVFEVEDTGCGMDLTNSTENPGRLDRFLSLGLSGIAGLKTDEFGWKGIGSKLAFRSTKVEVDTIDNISKLKYHVVIDDPWKCIEERRMPKPSYSEYANVMEPKSGTKIKVYGYPLYKIAGAREINFDNVKEYLLHRTFAGFTRKRENSPKLLLKAVDSNGEKIEDILDIGFPVLKNAEINNDWFGIKSENNNHTVIVSKIYTKNFPSKSSGVRIHLKGLYTDPAYASRYGLDSSLAQGIILAVNGIPYCKLDLKTFAKGGLKIVPGEENMCFVVECDEIGRDMNIGRNGYTPSERTQLFEQLLTEIIEDINSSEQYNHLVKILREHKQSEIAEDMTETLKKIEEGKYGWIYLKDEQPPQKILHRVPQTEQDVLAILWKLEGAGKLKTIFKEFTTLAATTGKGTDLWVNFKETDMDVLKKTLVEAKYRFTPKGLGHHPRQTPIVFCWEIADKIRARKDERQQYKYSTEIDNVSVIIYVLSEMRNLIEIKPPTPKA